MNSLLCFEIGRGSCEFECIYNELLSKLVCLFYSYTKSKNLFLSDKQVNFYCNFALPYLYLYALSTWEVNEDGSTTDKYNYLEQLQVNNIILALSNLLDNEDKEIR